ncbi:MAG TPA: hypothetical protein VFG39_02405 [Balneolaceae bacterium]|nr:hypothetical protein [Balneolaceae bacterium]
MRSPKVLVLTLTIGVLITLKPDSVKAQAHSDEGGSLGVGLMLGEPTGVSVKIWNNEHSAFDIGAAWSLAGRTEALHLHVDYLLHSWFNDIDEENLAFYYGIGGRVIFADDPTAGIRIPVGLNYVFQAIPFDIFIEAAPILDITPEVELAGNGAVGLRYYF